MSYVIILAIFAVLSNVKCESAPCKLTEQSCLNKITLEAYPKIMKADPELKMESMDPMHHDLIVTNLSNLHAEFTDTSVLGFGKCKMENVTLNELKLHFDLICPKLIMMGKYTINGKLIVLPVNGSGDFKIDSNKYKIAVDADLNLVKNEEEKSHVMIKDFKLTSEPLEKIHFDFKNLFNGNKELADVVLKFANEDWRAVAHEVNGPVLNADFKKIFKNANKYLKTVPVEK